MMRFRIRKATLSLFCLIIPLVISASHRPLIGTKPQFTLPPRIDPNDNSAVPLAATIAFATDRPVRTQLLLNDGQSTKLIYETDAFARSFSLPILGLRASRTYSIGVIITDEFYGQTQWPLPLQITTGALPTPFPAIQATVSEPQSMERGVTLFTVNQQNFGYIIAADEQGEVVWYYRDAAGGLSDVRQLSNGHLLFADNQGAAEIDALGNLVQRWHSRQSVTPDAPYIDIDTDTIHHEIAETRAGNLLTLSSEVRVFANYPTSETDPNAATGPSAVVGDVVLEFERNGRLLHYWSLLDILDPFRTGFNSLSRAFFYPDIRGPLRDWSHGNAVIEDVSDDSYIVSLRHQDALVKIDRTTGRLIWILGTPDGWTSPWSRYLLAPEGPLQWPYHQHAPMLTPDHTLLLFDNGNFRRRPTEPLPTSNYSRAVEFAIDAERKTVRQVWSYGPEQEFFFSSALGDADWMPVTHNILVTDGFRSTDTLPNLIWGRIFEVTHTTPARKVFEITVRNQPGTNLSWNVYRAERLVSLYPPQPR